ncbi:MAG TPA: hypothetical protein VEC96_02055 [Anaerolineae bacterium]|nr:hypothetical protein [Anaerolineae bacterium]HXV99647.1 hypothetical protein [Anaerolineae bacterium]
MIQKVLKLMQSLARWFFGAPFRQLPPEFGETVPPELQAFEANAEARQRYPQGSVQWSNSGGSQQTESHY